MRCCLKELRRAGRDREDRQTSRGVENVQRGLESTTRIARKRTSRTRKSADGVKSLLAWGENLRHDLDPEVGRHRLMEITHGC